MQTAAAAPQLFPSCTDESRQEMIPVETVVPVKKGVRSSPCFGEILSMHGKYGWIKPLQPIDHKDVQKHESRIYLKAKDMRRGEVPKPKSIVKFFLYVDRQGLGAEDCHVISEAQTQQGGAGWQSTWQQWEKKPWQQREKAWSTGSTWHSKGTWNSWQSAPARRPEPLVMIEPQQLVQRGTAAPMLVSSSLWCPEKPWNSDAVSEDDSTSAGDSASDVGEEHEVFSAAPPGLELQPWMVPPPPGLELQLRSMPPPPGLELLA